MFWWAGVVLPLVTIGAIFFAAVQVRETKKQAQATLLLNLIDKWNTEKMHQGRAVFDEVETIEKRTIFTQHVGLSEKECTKKLKEHFRITMAEIDRTDSRKYTAMLDVLSFSCWKACKKTICIT
jgi:hypothetical protein